MSLMERLRINLALALRAGKITPKQKLPFLTESTTPSASEGLLTEAGFPLSRGLSLECMVFPLLFCRTHGFFFQSTKEVSKLLPHIFWNLGVETLDIHLLKDRLVMHFSCA